MEKNNIIATIGLAAVAALGVYTYKMYTKVNKIADNLDMSIDALANMTSVEVKDEIIDRAVEKKVTEVASQAVKKSVAVIAKDIEDDCKKDIKKAVDAEYDLIKGSVKSKIESEIKGLNIDQVRREVVKEAKETAAKKFENDLDEVLNKYSDNLDKVTTIYSNIAQKMNPKSAFEF